MSEHEPLPRFFFSTFAYGGCKVVGNEVWPTVLADLLEHPERGPEVLGRFGAAFATLYEARHVAEVAVHVSSNSYIPRARCVAAANFLRGIGVGCDVWVTCDDDTWTDRDTLRRLVTACRTTRGLVALPSTNRDGHSMCYRRVRGPTEWWLREDLPRRRNGRLIIGDRPEPDRLPLRRVDRIGQGLVAMHRDFIALLDADCPPLARFRDRMAKDALDCPGIFLAGPLDGEWCGEDYYLTALAEKAGLPCHVLLDAAVQHEDLSAKLDLDGRVCLQGPTPEATARAIEVMTSAVDRMNDEARAAGIPVDAAP